MKDKTTNNGRRPGQTQICINLPTALVKQIDNAASKENRNRSNWIVTKLTEITEK